MSSRRLLALLSVLSVTGGLVVIGPPAAADHAITIQVGAQLGGRKLPAESNRFFGPDTIVVLRGDTITFDFHGFHTATLLPEFVSPDDWVRGHMTPEGPEGDWGFVKIDPDENTGDFKDNFSRIAEPTQDGCGGEGENPCEYTGPYVLNSGVPSEPGDTFTVTIDADGEFWVICLIHGHHMRKKISVLGPSEATSQEEIDRVTRRQLADDRDWAAATHEKYGDRQTSHKAASGRRVWDAWAGVDSRHVSLYAFYPKRLSIEKGDVVRWHFSELLHEDHTVSMPDPGIFRRLEFDRPLCDPGGDSANGQDTEPEFDPQTGEPICPEGSELEVETSDEFWGGAGDGVLSGPRDVEHSGIRGVQAELLTPPAAGVDSFDVRFEAKSGNEPFRYFCFLHPMRGKVDVD